MKGEELASGTDRFLDDQPLTIEITLPAGWNAAKIAVKNKSGASMQVHLAEQDGHSLLRVEIPKMQSMRSPHCPDVSANHKRSPHKAQQPSLQDSTAPLLLFLLPHRS